MADDKRGRDKKARDAERRQRERDVETELERSDETEPAVDSLEDVESELEALEFPATGSDVVEAVRERTVETPEKTYTLAEPVPDTTEEPFESPADVRARIRRPTVATAVKRVVEASEALPRAGLARSQRNAYQKTFEELEAIDAVDEDEGIRVVADWIVEQIREKEKLPGSRAVRRRAAKYCRTNGYQIREDQWLGV